MNESAPFEGFPHGTLRFLNDLAANNTREWFEARRADYEQYYVAPALAFVQELGPRLRGISKTVKFEARVNGSLFRIQRDLRFAKDRSPYKTHLDLWFWEGARRGWDTPSFFFRVTPVRLVLGAGMHRLAKGPLDRYRQAVIDSTKGPALDATLEEVRRAGPYEIGGATRKTVPRGFDPMHERAGLLLHDALFASLEGSIPAEVHTHDFVDYCAAHFQAVWPVNRWLLTALAAGD